MVIKLVTMEEVDIGLNRPYAIPLAIMEQVLIVMIEVYIDLRTSTILPTTQVEMIEEAYLGLNITDTLTFLSTEQVLMVMGEVDIGLRTATLPPITQVVMRSGVDLGIKRPPNIPF